MKLPRDTVLEAKIIIFETVKLLSTLQQYIY